MLEIMNLLLWMWNGSYIQEYILVTDVPKETNLQSLEKARYFVRLPGGMSRGAFVSKREAFLWSWRKL